MSIHGDYLEKVYAGLLGKCIGIRIGAPVEPTIWTYDRIRKTYGDITSYVKDYRNFAADDDFNGPAFFIRALVDAGRNIDMASPGICAAALAEGGFSAVDVGRAWLNYTREEKGFYWWGGYGRSTEHTAYLNLASGLAAPDSGSIATNGADVAEQIGGQIFVDTWGLVFPGDPRRAAEYAGMAASVSHDGNGLYGGQFIAAAISKAFVTADIDEILDAALCVIPADSEYARVVNAVRVFHSENPGDFRACMAYLTAEFGYDRYPGVCHIIPNAGVCILSLLYGAGNLSRTVEIATMCGWDTDCNAGNVGTIVGVAGGIAGVDDRYRIPMNDFFACSSIAGSLNIVDLPTFAKQLATLGVRLAPLDARLDSAGSDAAANAAILASLGSTTRFRELNFDFALPGSTHGFRTDSNALSVKHCDLSSADDGAGTSRGAVTSRGALEVLVDRIIRGTRQGVFFKPFYRREDFDDERYSPAFTPLVHSGQTMRFEVMAEKWSGSRIAVIPYARETWKKTVMEGGTVELSPGSWTSVEFVLPDSCGAAIDEIGFKVESLIDERWLGRILMRNFSVSGKASYSVDFAKQSPEFATITPGTTNRGFWTLENGSLQSMSVGRAEFYTGNYYSRDLRFRTSVTPLAGEGHGVLFRAKGAMMGYAVVLASPGRVVFLKNDFGLSVVEEKAFDWQYGTPVDFDVEVVGTRFTVSIGGRMLFDLEDDAFANGMIGFCRTARGRCLFGNIEVEELSEGL
ncbi:MAG: ADP-ribosylglycohydrolase family protein [Rectinemataceae bacterium]|nr:ADP-ribosylglycohydrolase family protein [Rectinemataceae bacterium]